VQDLTTEGARVLYGSVAESGGLYFSIRTGPLVDGAPLFARIDIGND
jgi:hypothetical protein